MRKNALIFILLGLLFLAPTRVAQANMAPPPSVVWFILEYENGTTPRLQGIQLVGCGDEACTQRVLLQQYGTCHSAGCLVGPVTLSGFSTSFACAGSRCRSTAYPNHGGAAFMLIAEFSDRVRQSSISGRLPAAFGEEASWTVLVRQADLSITPDATVPTINIPYERFNQSLGWLGLSILVEVAVAGVGMWLLARTVMAQWLSRLLVVFLANLATLPVVWLTFPAFGQF